VQLLDLGDKLVEALRPAGEELAKAIAAVVDGLLHPFREWQATTSSEQKASSVSVPPEAKAANARLAVSTFCCDIAYSVSPAASRASARST
jgi:hypothetical protein